ncbi:MAG: shikimate kinase [Lachnospiraceae bacterium]|nr:shikimate kinase [Lachnospiraceae bacterium]
MAGIDFNLMLIGFMGTGKSTIAAKLKEVLKVEQIEMDALIAEEAGMSIPDIFEKFGESHFRDLETEMLRKFKEKKPVVVSCGGGAVLRDENIEIMKGQGKIILLTATPETIYERVKDSNDRPVLNGNMNVAYISELMEKRRARYEMAADIVITTDGKDADEICNEILEAVNVK